jgi:hypothetical protein
MFLCPPSLARRTAALHATSTLAAQLCTALSSEVRIAAVVEGSLPTIDAFVASLRCAVTVFVMAACLHAVIMPKIYSTSSTMHTAWPDTRLLKCSNSVPFTHHLPSPSPSLSFWPADRHISFPPSATNCTGSRSRSSMAWLSTSVNDIGRVTALSPQIYE